MKIEEGKYYATRKGAVRYIEKLTWNTVTWRTRNNCSGVDPRSYVESILVKESTKEEFDKKGKK